MRGLLVLAAAVAMAVGTKFAASCDAPQLEQSRIWSSIASTTLTVEVGDPIDALPSEKFDRVSVERTHSGDLKAQSVVLVPSGYWVDASSTLTIADDQSNSISLFYRLAPVPAGQPILGCDTSARLTFLLGGLRPSPSEGKDWSIRILKLDLDLDALKGKAGGS